MAKRLSILVFLLIGLVLIVATAAPSRAQEGGDDERAEAARRGAVLYVQYCGSCHGAEGEAIGTGEGFVSIADYNPDFAEGRITNGFDANPENVWAMPGYGESADGPLTNAQIDDILVYMTAWNDPELETPVLPEPNISAGEKEYNGAGDPDAGAVVYAYSCLGCHGADTQGLDLANFPAFSINANTIRVVATGDGHGFVPAFAQSSGGTLSTDDLTNLEAYLNTLEIESEEDGPQGVSILIVVLGLGAVLAVGGAYMASRRMTKQA